MNGASDATRFLRAYAEVLYESRLKAGEKHAWAFIRAAGPEGPVSYEDIARTGQEGVPTATTAVQGLLRKGFLHIVEERVRVNGKLRGTRYRARIPNDGDGSYRAA